MTALVTLVIMAFLSRSLEIEEYGVFRQVLLVFSFAIPIFSFSMSESLNFHLPRNENDGKRTVLTNFVILTIGGLLLFVLLNSFSVSIANLFDNAELSKYLKYYSYYGLLFLPTLSVAAVLLTYRKTKILVGYNLITKLILGVTVCMSAWYIGSLENIFSMYIIAGFITFILALFIYLKYTKGQFTKLPLSGFKAQLLTGYPIVIAAIVASFAKYLDKFLVSSYFSTETFAIYVNGAEEVPFVSIVTGSVIGVLLPEFSRLYASSDKSGIIDLWKRAGVKVSLILFPATFFLMAMAPELMVLLFSETYRDSAQYFRIYLIVLPLRVFFFNSLMIASGKTKVIGLMNLLSISINLIVSIILLQIIGPSGAALGSVTAIIIFSGIYIYVTSGIYDISVKELIPIKKLSKVFLGSFLALVPMFIIMFFEMLPIEKFLISATIYFISYFIFIKWSGLIKLNYNK